MTGRDYLALRGIARTVFVAPPDEWMHRAACVGHPEPSIFYVTFDSSNPTKAPRDRKAALAVCRDCPVRRECLEYALTVEGDCCQTMRHGTWGGTSPAARQRIVNARRAVVA